MKTAEVLEKDPVDPGMVLASAGGERLAWLDAESTRALVDHARRDYPNECCGLLLRAGGSPAPPLRLRECVNAQDRYHRSDPANFPRTSRNAYFLDPRELLQIDRACRKSGESIAAVYHSHCDAEAYFSEEDVNRALDDGRPLFPGVYYLVLSVRCGRPIRAKTFCWCPESGRFELAGEASLRD